MDGRDQLPAHRWGDMSSEDLEKYETEMELQLYREYRDVVSLFPTWWRRSAASTCATRST